MPFGGGTRQCAGAEFSKVYMAAFLHVLVTKYRYYLFIYLFIYLRKNVAYHGDRESKMIMLLFINVTDGQR